MASTRTASRSADGPHDVLARGVLATLMRIGSGPEPRRLAALVGALADPAPERAEREVADLLAGGVAPEEVVDRYVPAAARALGEGWCRDTLGFAAVTIGGARLQRIVRALAGEDAPAAAPPGAGRTALIVLPEGESHGLGALVAADQLRRAGVSTRISLGRPAHHAAAMLRGARPDIVLLSCACGTAPEAVAATIRTLRAAARGPVPIALGGSIVTAPPEAPGAPGEVRLGDPAADAARLAKATGADHVGGDVAAALRALVGTGARRRARAMAAPGAP